MVNLKNLMATNIMTISIVFLSKKRGMPIPQYEIAGFLEIKKIAQ